MARATIDFGIDLGTTNSTIAAMDHGHIRVFKNAEGVEHTPSVVRIDRAGSLHVGRRAYQHLHDDPANTHAEFKRLMGTAHQLAFKASGRAFTPEALSAEVLKSLRADAARGGFECEAAVITVPAYFEIVACEATQRSAAAAGLVAAPLLQEPIAAAIAAGRDLASQADGYWLVYDLGGGTFDVAIIGRKGGHLSVVDCTGDNHLGGTDFDWLIADRLVMPALRGAFNLPALARGNERYRTLLAKLKAVAEDAKIVLTGQTEATVDLENCGEDEDRRAIELTVPIRRQDYEALIRPLVTKTIQLCRQTLERARLSPAAIERVILVGGPTMTPAVRAAIQDGLGVPVDVRLDPLTVVAQGAAIFASAQVFPHDKQRRAPGKVLVKLSFAALSQQPTTMVAGRLEASAGSGASGAVRVQILRDDGGWQSGLLPVTDGAFVCPVALRQNHTNTFHLAITDGAGQQVPAEPESFCITHGLSVANPPLQRTIGVEVVTERGEGRYEALVPRGTPLPAKRTRTFRAAHAVVPGSADQVLNINVHEGEHETPEHNRYLGTLSIKGSQIRRSLPANAEIEVTLSVDASRHCTAEAFVPILDETFREILTEEVAPKPDVNRLARELSEAQSRWEGLSRPETRARDSAPDIEHQFTEATVELAAAHGGDPGALEKADRLIREIQAQVLSEQKAGELPTRLRDLDQALEAARRVVGEHGQGSDQAELAAIERDAERAKERRDARLCQTATDRLWQLHWNVLARHDGFWIGMFQQFAEEERFTDPQLAQRLIAEGGLALQAQDMGRLREVTRQLWVLVPREVQQETTRRVSDAGIK